MRSIVYKDNRKSLGTSEGITVWIKEDFIARFCALSFRWFSSSLPPFFSLFLLHIIQTPCPFLLLILVPLQVSNALLSFPYLSLSSLSSTPLHYEDQLKIAPRKCIFFFLLDSLILKNLHYNLLIHLFKACFTPHENMHWVPSEFVSFS